MQVKLEQQESLLVLISGMYHEDVKDKFRMSALGLTKDNNFVIYDDHSPDKIDGSDYIYSIKRRVSFSQIQKVLIQNVESEETLYYMHRINVICKSDKNSFVFYYNGDQFKRVNSLIRLLKKAQVKVTRKDFILD